METKSSTQLFNAELATAEIEDTLCDLFPEGKFDHFGYDRYDTSIEVCVAADAVVNDEAAFLAQCEEWGFGQGWINYADGSEQHFNCYTDPIKGILPRMGKRAATPNPRWTEKNRIRWLENESGGIPLEQRRAFRRFLAAEQTSKMTKD